MKNQGNRFRQVSLMTLLIVTLLSGVFASAFRRGFAVGENERSFGDFESLIALIESTVVPNTWMELGGPATMAAYPTNISSECYAEVVDHMADAGIVYCVEVFQDPNEPSQ